MTAIPVLNADGATAGEASFTGPIAEQEIKPHLIHETVVAELGYRRAGTHKTKNRGEVRGGGRKPWRQKGTGRARQGSIRAPQWTGGGVTFGPTPRSYGGKVNRKVRAQAFRAALRAHADRGSLAVMDPTGWEKPSTKAAAAYLYQAPDGLAARPLVVLVEDPDGVEGLSFRNLEGVYVLAAADLEVVDAMAARSLLVERAVWERLTGGELEVSAVEPALKSPPVRTAPPEAKPITRAKPEEAKPKRGRRKAAEAPADEPSEVDETQAPVADETVEQAAAPVEEPQAEEAPEAAAVEEKPKRTRAKPKPAEDAPEGETDAAEAPAEGKPKRTRTKAEPAAEEEVPVAEAEPEPKPRRKKADPAGEDEA